MKVFSSSSSPTTVVDKLSPTFATPRKRFEIPNSYQSHPGGQSTLASAKNHPHRDILFLSNHIGLDVNGEIAKQAKARGVTLPTTDSVLYHKIHLAAQNLIKKDKSKIYHHHVLVYHHIWCLFLTIALPTSLIWFIKTGHLYYIMIFHATMLSYGFNIFHSRWHRGGKIYNTPWLDNITRPLYDFYDCTLAIHPNVWRKNHNDSHHVYTNDHDNDYDVYRLFGQGLRLNPKMPYYYYHKYQPFYIPILFALSIFSFPIDNYFEFGGSIIHFATYFMTMYILPVYFHGWNTALYCVCCTMCTSLIISYLFQVSHNHVDTHKKKQNENNKSNFILKNQKHHDDYGNDDNDSNNNNNIPDQMNDWIASQIAESCNWGGYLGCLFFGGINYQIEHHVAPSLPPPLY